MPQAPQLLASLERSCSQPSVASALQSPQPESHAISHLPTKQLGPACAPPVHVLPHPPQLLGSLETSVSHPLLVSPSQSFENALHAFTPPPVPPVPAPPCEPPAPLVPVAPPAFVEPA